MAEPIRPVLCGGCGVVLAEARGLPMAERAPCPRCGSKARRSQLLARALVAIGADDLSAPASLLRARIKRMIGREPR